MALKKCIWNKTNLRCCLSKTFEIFSMHLNRNSDNVQSRLFCPNTNRTGGDFCKWSGDISEIFIFHMSIWSVLMGLFLSKHWNKLTSIDRSESKLQYWFKISKFGFACSVMSFRNFYLKWISFHVSMCSIRNVKVF